MSDLEKRQKVYDYLKRLEVKYTVTEHPAVFSIDEIKALKINLKGDVCKNLFLRDSAGERHFLVTMRNDKTAPLKVLQQKLGISRLSFASQERLAKRNNCAFPRGSLISVFLNALIGQSNQARPQHPDAVAQLGGLLELEITGGLAHFFFKLGHQQCRILGGKREGVRLLPFALATALAAPA